MLSSTIATDHITYNSFSGTDIVAEIVIPGESPIVIGELQTLSYSIHRENTPIRFLGQVNPVSFLRGPRMVAGSLIFTVFNQYAFYRLKQYQSLVKTGLYPLADMLPVFDIAISFLSEYGAMSQMRIYGITIVDEGQTMSVDDLITEQTYTFIAQGILPMTVTATDMVSSNYIQSDLNAPTNTFAVPLQVIS